LAAKTPQVGHAKCEEQPKHGKEITPQNTVRQATQGKLVSVFCSLLWTDVAR